MDDYKSHQDYQSFLAAIAAAPDDDLPRLVFADWLDERAKTVCEKCRDTGSNDLGTGYGVIPCAFCATNRVSNGAAERAEFIRVQCRIAEVESRPVGKGVEKFAATVAAFIDPEAIKKVSKAKELTPLVEREQWLMESHELALLAGAPLLQIGWQANSTWVPEAEWEFHRGFVHKVTTASQWWCGGRCSDCQGNSRVFTEDEEPTPPCPTCDGKGTVPGFGREIVAAQPLVAEVVLSDKQPEQRHMSGGYRPPSWSPHGPYDPLDRPGVLPEELLEHVRLADLHWAEMPGGAGSWLAYETDAEALNALSTATIAWAKTAPARSATAENPPATP